LVDLPRSTAYLVPANADSNNSLVSMNTVDGIAPGTSATVTARFNAPPSETTEVLVMVEYLLPVTVPIRPEGTPVRDDPVLALPKGTRSTEERVVSCTAKGADGPAGQPTAVELRLPSDVLFEFGSAALSGQAVAAIESLKDKIPSGGGTVSVEGHTDAIGDDAANQTLSEQRAAAVRGALAAQLGSGYTFAPAGFGERKPDRAQPECRR
jgi:outer membrane protein OmpA-like peptidoglycan-associated protein